MAAAGDPPTPSAAPRLGRRLARGVLLPIGVVVGLAFIAVALIEGPALQQFLYAVF